MATNSQPEVDEKSDTTVPEVKKSLSNNPTSFYEALVDRYLNAEEFHLPSFVHFKAPPSNNFELDGCKLGKLKTLGLDGKYIYKAGIPAEGLSGICPNVNVLHLARNNLQNWSEIKAILREFPHLEECNLQKNVFNMPPDELSNKTPPILCPKLQTLYLTYTYICWSEIQHIAVQCPKLRVVDLCGNNISTISTEALGYMQNIVVLTLSSNNLKSWNEVLKLGVLPKLEALHLSNNPISFSDLPDETNNTDSSPVQELKQSIDKLSTAEQDIATPPNEDPKPKEKPIPLFPSLNTISLATVNICKWEELDIIAELPVLNIRLKDIPLGSDISQEDLRKVFISWFPNVVKLNGSTCEVEERVKAERFTIRYFNPLEYKPKRLPILIKKHGDLKPLRDIDISFGYKEFVDVEFIYKSKLWRKEKISVKQTVRELSIWVYRQMNRPKYRFKFYHLPSSAKAEFDKMEELQMSSLPLSRFDIHDGDQIIIC